MEIARCKRDIVYFAEHYARIINLDKGLHVIKLYDIQKEFLRFLVDNNRVICCSGRQQGKSTIYCIYACWLTQFFPEKAVMILANKAATSIELVQKISDMWRYLPPWLKSAAVVVNQGTIAFSNKSSIRGFASSSDAARGFSANVVICDEFAFLQKSLADKLFTSMFPVISSSKNGKFIIVSTPNGTDNLYYEIWQKANNKEAGKNLDGWKAFTMWWWQVPGHDEAWKAKQIEAIGAVRFAQEFNNEFLANSSTRKLVPDDILEQYRMRLSGYRAQGVVPKTQKILSESMDKVYEFKMWHEFDPKRAYLASADTAEGVGGDSSVLYVWDVTDTSAIRMCAAFSSNRASLVEFAFVASRILKLYCNPWLFAERNGVSAGMLDSLRITYGYGKIARESKNGEPGVYSHISVKGKACLWAKDMLTTAGFGFVVYDKDLVDEMGTFVKKDTKGTHAVYQAALGAHDDCIMAFIWACWALSTELVDKYFVVCETFTSVYQQILPKTIQPAEGYREDMIKAVSKDPLYTDFLSFKDEAEGAWKRAAEAEQAENAADPFGYGYSPDPYFGDERPNMGRSVNPNNVMPAFFV